MFIRIKPIANSPRKRVQICACSRVDGKVKQKVIKHVGIAENDTHLEELTKLAHALKAQIKKENDGPYLFDITPYYEQKEPQTPIADPIQETPSTSHLVDVTALKEESRIVDGFHDVFGTLFNQLGFHKVLKKNQSDILRDVVLARIAQPSSKLGTQQILAADFCREIGLDRIYRMMDVLQESADTFQKAVFAATEQFCLDTIDFVLFDVTTLYFESTKEDELRTFGYSKDQKFHSIQVVLALATTPQGLPIGYRLFPGDTAEVSTLLQCVQHWKEILPIGGVRVVADRAMMSEKNLQFLEENNIGYVVAAKLRKQPKAVRDAILKSPREKVGLVCDMEVSGRRLLATFCPERASKDSKDRERILEKIAKRIGKGKNAKKLISNSGYQKYLSSEGDADLFLDEIKIAQDAMWDGYHGVITNCKEEEASEILKRYRGLWVIEESFRLHKHNLSLRPIYHFKPERIEAHILICYLAFALIRHMEFRVKIQKEEMSIEQMRNELWRVQSSYLKDVSSGHGYRLPSKTSSVAKRLYQVMGIKRSEVVQSM